jgi:hypothetical protein
MVSPPAEVESDNTNGRLVGDLMGEVMGDLMGEVPDDTVLCVAMYLVSATSGGKRDYPLIPSQCARADMAAKQTENMAQPRRLRTLL